MAAFAVTWLNLVREERVWGPWPRPAFQLERASKIWHKARRFIKKTKHSPVADQDSTPTKQPIFSPPTEVPLHEPPIFTLPVELIQDIAKTCLPPSSAAVLAFCNQRLLRVIGGHYWELCNLNDYHEEKLILLSLLAKDSVDTINCHRCVRLHKSAFAGDGRKCGMDDIGARAWSILRYGFRFVHLQMAVKVHSLGLDPSPILDHVSVRAVSSNKNDRYSEPVRV
ncbi:MAG: hypothetical protein M1818_005773 [Claussenomyces sp. TS43310]|nr:MAG: hypothetical protein M1818_005773 [Claussenomyces sp. TS43310]